MISTSQQSTKNPDAFLAYIPVLHQGYLQFFAKYPEVKKIYLVNESLTRDFRQLEKDIRALPTSMMVKIIKTLNRFDQIEVLTKENIADTVNDPGLTLIIPEETEMIIIKSEYFDDARIIWDSIFLRWDTKKSLTQNEVKADYQITTDQFDQKMMQEAVDWTKQSGDWWRQVAGVIVQDGQIILEGWNRHVPNEQQPYVFGDPRGNFHKGEHLDKSTAFHVEAMLVAQAAARGLSLEGASLYVTTFPCPYCAKVVAYSGIKKLYFLEGYSMVDGQDILKHQGVEIIKVN